MRDGSFLLILMYHQLFTNRPADSYSVAVGDFERQMRRLSAEGFVSVIPENLSRCSYGRKVMITFDDGYASDYWYALPVLREHGFSGVSFITTSYIGTPGYLRRDQVEQLHHGGFSIQSHTHTHPLLECCTPGQICHELAYSKTVLESWLKSSVTGIALPGGSHPAAICEAAAAAGYEHVFSSFPCVHEIPLMPGSALGRVCISSRCSEDDFARIVGGEPGAYFWAAAGSMLRNGAKRILGRPAYHLLWRMVRKPRKGGI